MHTSSGLDTGLRFPGQVYHWESELHQNWMRDYDPTTGRYIQGDPLGLEPGPALYSYAYQSPGKFVDPDGRNPGAVVYYGVVYGGRLLSAGGRLLAKYWARGRGATAVGAAAAVTPTIPSDNDGAIPDDATPDGEMCEPKGPSCTDHFEMCIDSGLGSSSPGPNWGMSDCGACLAKCVADNGEWPSSLSGYDRCDYWNFPGGKKYR